MDFETNKQKKQDKNGSKKNVFFDCALTSIVGGFGKTFGRVLGRVLGGVWRLLAFLGRFLGVVL